MRWQHASHTSSLLHRTGVKRSAFGRLSGRQRSYADEVEGGEERQRPGNGRSHNRPLRGLLRSLFSTPSAKGERGLPTRHSLRERRLPLDVIRNAFLDFEFSPLPSLRLPYGIEISAVLLVHADSTACSG